MRPIPLRWLLALSAVLLPTSARATATLDGAHMGWPWAIPFAGILLSIALGPLLFRRFWHHHYGKIAAFWAFATLSALSGIFGPQATLAAVVHTMLSEYLGFIVLLFALYTVAGGILITGDVAGTPWSNTLLLALGTVLASIVGTTGAAMILVRPLIRGNAARRYKVHVLVFFIFLVANIGGALTPLGDQPLVVGFLRGVDFFWPAAHLWMPTLIGAAFLLALFFGMDLWLSRREPTLTLGSKPVRIHGLVNALLIGAVIATILLSVAWPPLIATEIIGTPLVIQNVIRDVALISIAALSLLLTREEHREANGFTWEPIREVAKLFAAIFVCIIPVIAMLQEGTSGRFAFLLHAVTAHDGKPNEQAFFWLAGMLSALLDNAPTYLVFFELAGGDAKQLMTTLAPTLAAISMGAVYMGALTYIGNAPNFMIVAIADEYNIEMPSFFGYMIWASVILLPLFAALSTLFVG